MTYDFLIIGGGVSGTSIARELSKYETSVCLLEKEVDVCCGTSKANSAIVHAGYDCKPGTMMARMNVRGNEMMEQLSRELDFSFIRNGSFVVCIDESEKDGLKKLLEQGEKNGVKGLRILNRDEALEREPNLSDNVVAALYAPSAGIVCPFNMNIAFAENANVNGCEFFFNTKVEGIVKKGDIWRVCTNNGEYETKCVINAAGVYADAIHNMVSENKMHITPRRGDYLLLDKAVGNHVKHTIFPQPTKLGKGVLVAPTVHGNLIVGPTAVDIDDKEATATTDDGLSQVIRNASSHVKNLPLNNVITSFSGLRAHEDNHEFIIGEVKDAADFFDCAGIESPGLTSAPAIGEYMAGLLKEKYNLKKKSSVISARKGITHLDELTLEEKNELIKENPAYGRTICRCESVTEGEIIEAIKRPLGARTLDGIKRRARAGSGRCQAGFCSPKVMDILARELELPLEEITKSGGKSHMVIGRSKEDIQ